MKLILINASLTDGGSERAMCLLGNEMAKQGHDVTMLLVRDKPHIYHLDSSVQLIQLHYPKCSKIVMLVKRLSAIRRIVKQQTPDAIISFMWDINAMTLLATIGLNGPMKIVSERNFPASPNRSKIAWILERTIYCLADRIVYQTEQAKSYCPKFFTPKAVVIPNIVEPPSIGTYKGKRAKRVVSVGRLVPQKNFPLLIRAFSRFNKQIPGYSLDIYGEGSQRKALEAMASKKACDATIRFNGYVREIASEIKDASMFVLASDYEGISNAMMEAMAIGLPVICTDCPAGGAALVIQSGVNGLLVPVGDEDALLDAMLLLARNEGFRDRLSINAKQVTIDFSAEKIVRKWVEAIQQ